MESPLTPVVSEFPTNLNTPLLIPPIANMVSFFYNIRFYNTNGQFFVVVTQF